MRQSTITPSPSALLTTITLTAFTLTGCAYNPTTHSPSQTHLHKGMGPHTRTISTNSKSAQQYFNQALNWAYAFNHNAAIRSYNQAALHDPNCPMPYWGIALANGPHINNPVMPPDRSIAAWDALQKALARLHNASPVERDLINALAKRYANPAPEDRSNLDRAYADAMANVHAKYPNDTDVATLYAEALMDLNPWNLYTTDRQPREGTNQIVLILEKTIAQNPQNPGANHLLIHAVEPSDNPHRAMQAADRLRNMVPASGHLLHMPSHIDVLTGQWENAIVQNQKAMIADDIYRKNAPPQRFQHLYMAHNAHMLTFAAMMTGREPEANKAARDILTNIPENALRQGAEYLDGMVCAIYDVQKRFGRWDDILAEPQPPEFLPITNAMWRMSRAIAYAAKQDFANAKREHDNFRNITNTIPEDRVIAINPARKVLAIADHLITGEIALQQGHLKQAAHELEKGAAIEDTLLYMEPPEWIQPIRHTLGAVYLKDSRYHDAERAYRQDLKKWPNNGWSLFGLSRALESQGKHAEARKVHAQYQQSWKFAPEPTTTSCKCLPNT
jgi:tetratricopeptide (TPR) repeat protein